MTPRWRRLLPSIVAFFMLVLILLLAQHLASPQDDSSGQIAYESSDEQESAIYLMNPDGSRRSQVMLVKTFSSVCCAAWSSDGKRLAYAVQQYDPTSPTSLVESVNVFDLATRRHTAIKCSTYPGYLCSGRGVFRLRWSREDQCFAWITKDSTRTFLREIPISTEIDSGEDSSCGKDLPFLDIYTIGLHRDFTYSPNGKWYLQAVYYAEDNEFRSFLVSTSGISISLGVGMVRWFDWSPNSTHLAFTFFDYTGKSQNPLFLMGVNDAQPHLIITELDVKGDPTWSPDSRWIAFGAAGNDGNIDIYKVNIETKEVTRLTTDLTDDRNPVWRPAPKDRLGQ